MSCAAVVSLAQTIDRIRQHDQYDSISLPANQEIVSIRDHAAALQEFLDDFPEKATDFEERITEVAYKAEDFIEYLMLEKIGSSHCGSTNSTVVGVSKVKLKRQLRKTAEKMKSIVEEVTEISAN